MVFNNELAVGMKLLHDAVVLHWNEKGLIEVVRHHFHV